MERLNKLIAKYKQTVEHYSKFKDTNDFSRGQADALKHVITDLENAKESLAQITHQSVTHLSLEQLSRARSMIVQEIINKKSGRRRGQ